MLGDADADLIGLNRLKWIPLAPDGEVALTLGGSIREQFESYQNREFGFAEGANDTYLMHRLLLHADLRIGDHVRAFGELGNSLIIGRDAEPAPVDENELYLHQGFVDLLHGANPSFNTRLRVGRQEMPFGSGRLVSTRDGPNNRLSFDASRLTLSGNQWSVDAFIASPVDLEPGVFDDRVNDDTLFWGLYTTVPSPAGPTHSLDLYYLGIHRDDRSFGLASGSENRHTFGVRAFGHHHGFDYNIEPVFQVGELGSSDIRAWTIATDLGYTWQDHSWKPRLGLRSNITSGAGGDTETTETFDALFPRNSYFSEAAVVFPANLIDVNPTLSVEPTKNLRVDAMWDFLWRTSTSDAVYGPPGVPLFNPDASSERFVGHSLSLLATYQLDRHSSFSAAYTRFFAGEAVTSAGGDDVDYFAIWYEFKF